MELNSQKQTESFKTELGNASAGYSKKNKDPYFEVRNSFIHFFYEWFSLAIERVDGKYIYGEHIKNWCYRLQFNNRTATIAPRFHLKTTTTLAYLAWKLFTMRNVYNEYSFMSYRSDLAAYHLKRLKRYILALPELFSNYKLNTQSEQIIAYIDPQGREFMCEPEGALVFKRGKHPDEMICDDILRDPESYMDLSQLDKIKRIFFEEVEQMPKHKLHIVGTPQDSEDLFYALAQTPTYNVKTYRAILDGQEKKTLWEELYSYDRLMEIKATIGDKAFNKEFMCHPVRSTEAFVSLDDYNKISNPALHNYDLFDSIDLFDTLVVGGFDIGKKAHPSHLSVFKEDNGRLIQIHSKFLDSWNYTDQIDYLKKCIDKFHIKLLYYDNSRAEFEETFERGELPDIMKPLSFTSKNSFALATDLDKVITNSKIELIPDERQKRQILSLDCDLRAPVTQDGHGDSFWSLCLAIKSWNDIINKSGGCEVPDIDVIGRNAHYR